MASTSPTPDAHPLWRDRPVAVTGATGFLGSHLVDALVGSGACVVALVRDDVPPSPIAVRWLGKVTLVRGEVEDQATVERMLADYETRTVFHLAAQSQVGVAERHPVATYQANIAGTWSVLEACRRSPHVEQVLTASSHKAYGDQPGLPYDETMPLLARNPYDVSKACADLLAQSYAHTYDLPVCIARCGNFFGPGDRNLDRLVPGAIRSLLRGERPVVHSDGTLVRDYLYVVDGALAYLRLAEALAADPSLRGNPFNFSSERPVDVLELLRLLQAAAGTDLEPDIRNDATNEVDRQLLSAAKAREVLCWVPRFTLEEALAETVAWYRNHLEDDR